jgi:sigma-B regulation protein RsbU (phosphoserine phosphatase)
MFVGILDLHTGSLDYCNAGHEAPLLSEKGEGDGNKWVSAFLPIKPNLPIGALSEWNYEGQQTQMRSGEMLFFYTDGLSEAKNTSGEQFGRKHVQQLTNEHSLETAQQLVETMEREVHLHVGDAMQSDDITMLVIRWQGNIGKTADIEMGQMPFSMTMRASMDNISCLEPFITNVTQKAGIEGREAKRLRLAVEEAVANVINHGQATTITLQAMMEGNQLVLTIDDDGLPFDPTQESPTDLSIPADERPPGGLGIMFLHEMTERLSYQRIDGHNILEIIKTIS